MFDPVRTEDDVSAIEPVGHDSGDEELGAVGVLSGVGHRQDTRLSVLQLEVLVCWMTDEHRTENKETQRKRTSKLLAVDGLSTSAVVLGEVTPLKHEVGDDAVEGRTLVTISVLASGEFAEVLRGFGDDVVVKLEGDPPSRGIVDGDVELQNVRSISSRHRNSHSSRGPLIPRSKSGKVEGSETTKNAHEDVGHF